MYKSVNDRPSSIWKMSTRESMEQMTNRCFISSIYDINTEQRVKYTTYMKSSIF